MKGVDLAWLVDAHAGMLVVVEELPVWFGYGVVDVETTGLDAGSDEMVGFGVVCCRYLLGAVRMYASDREVRVLARELVESMLRDGLRVYAWNKRFEEEWLGVRGLSELQLRMYESKDVSIYMGVEMVASGRDVPHLWRRWQRYRDAEALLKILWRAMYDAYVEAATQYRRRFTSLLADNPIIIPIITNRMN